MLKSALFFPESNNLKDKWWHRLATVIFWIWSCLVAWTLLVLIYATIFDPSFNYDMRSQPSMGFILFGGTIASAFIPGIIYRAILFISMGTSWKEFDGAA